MEKSPPPLPTPPPPRLGALDKVTSGFMVLESTYLVVRPAFHSHVCLTFWPTYSQPSHLKWNMMSEAVPGRLVGMFQPKPGAMSDWHDQGPVLAKSGPTFMDYPGVGGLVQERNGLQEAQEKLLSSVRKESLRLLSNHTPIP